MIGNWFNYIIFVVLIILGILFYNNYALVLMLIVVLVMPVISILIFLKKIKSVHFEITDLQKSVGRNGEIYFKIVTKNESFYPFGAITVKLHIKNEFYENDKDYIINLSSVPRKSTAVEWKCSSIYCGNIKVRIVKAEIVDMLYLVRKDIDVDVEQIVQVLPECEKETFEITAISDGEGEEDNTQYIKGNDVSDVANVREYVPGDALQTVHWKLSARMDEWMVKEFSMPYSNQVVLAVELMVNKSIFDEMDIVIEAFNSYANYLISQNRQFSMVWYDAGLRIFNEKRIITFDDVDNAMSELLYTKPSKMINQTYSIFQNTEYYENNTCLFVTGCSNERSIHGNRLGIYKEKAVILKI